MSAPLLFDNRQLTANRKKANRHILTNGSIVYEIFLKVRGSGRLRIRTADPLLVRQTL